MRLLGQQLAFLADKKLLLPFEFRMIQPLRESILREGADDFADPTDVTEMLLR